MKYSEIIGIEPFFDSTFNMTEERENYWKQFITNEKFESNLKEMHDICISIGSACNSKLQERSHVLLAMGLDEERIDSSVRISIGRYNTEEDIRELVKWISNCHRIAKIAEV